MPDNAEAAEVFSAPLTTVNVLLDTPVTSIISLPTRILKLPAVGNAPADVTATDVVLLLILPLKVVEALFA